MDDEEAGNHISVPASRGHASNSRRQERDRGGDADGRLSQHG